MWVETGDRPGTACAAGLPDAPLAAPVVTALRELAVPELDDARRTRAQDLLRGVHHAVGERHALAWPIDWRHNPGRDPEWLIEHHKMPVLVDLALCAEEDPSPHWLTAWADLLDGWLAQMGTGQLGYSDAQVEAKRIEHWLLSLAVWQSQGRTAAIEALRPGLLARVCQRLRQEAAYVLDHLRPSRNHRTFQLQAVWLVAVCLPGLPEAATWRERSHALLCANLLDDFGADGVHVELSSHYHQITLETALSFALTADAVGVALPGALEARLRAALRHSAWLLLPDGGMPLMNDADAGDHRRLIAAGARRHGDEGLAWLASAGRQGRAPQEPSAWFAEAGYLFSRSDWQVGNGPGQARGRGQHLFADFGELGAGSHAHYDLFNVCLSLAGRQVLVDPGRYTYHAEPDADGIDWRHAFKCTAAHNTVAIDGRDQTRYLSKARHPAAGHERLDRSRHASKHGPAVRAVDRRVMTGLRSDWACATALSQEYTPRHTRLALHVQRSHLLLIDHIEADDGLPHRAEAHLHLAADWLDRVGLTRCENTGSTGSTDWPVWQAGAPGWRLLLAARAEHAPTLRPGWVSRTYGIKQPAPVLQAGGDFEGCAVFVTVLAPDGDDGAIDTLEVQVLGDRVEVDLQGHDRTGAWTERTVLACGASRVDAAEALGLVCPEVGAGRARLLHRRLRGERLDHLVIGDAHERLFDALRHVLPGLRCHPGHHLEC